MSELYNNIKTAIDQQWITLESEVTNKIQGAEELKKEVPEALKEIKKEVLEKIRQLIEAESAAPVDVTELGEHIEAWRNLKVQLVEDAKRRFPFRDAKEADVPLKKIKEYRKLLQRLEKAYGNEETLWGRVR